MNLVSNDADIPTIFEYVVGIIWYRVSDYEGRILDFMNLSLDNNLLPRSHAVGGESDIVYKYKKNYNYNRHSLLIECTLMDSTNQRRGEMEPVSRHLSNYMLDEDKNAYCLFVATFLHSSVISDFRMRKNNPYYRNETEHVDSMKIIPITTQDLRAIIKNNIKYSELYDIFETAHQSSEKNPNFWYRSLIMSKIKES